jgi:hypothetical protein
VHVHVHVHVHVRLSLGHSRASLLPAGLPGLAAHWLDGVRAGFHRRGRTATPWVTTLCAASCASALSPHRNAPRPAIQLTVTSPV